MPPKSSDSIVPNTSSTRSSASQTPRPIRPLQAAVLLSAAILLSRVVGLGNQIVVSITLSPSDTDSFVAAFRIIDLVNYLIAGGAMSVTFIPIFTAFKDNDRARDAWRFFSTVATMMTAVLIVLLGVTMFAAYPIAALISKHDGAKLDTTVAMMRIMLPAQLFFYVGGMIVGVLNAHKRFGASSFTGAVYTSVALVLGVLCWKWSGKNALGFAVGILIGAFVGNFLLPLIASLRGPREERLQFRPSLDWKQPGVKQFFRNALPIMLGVSFPVVDQIVMPYFTGGLVDGSLTQLNNGNRIMVAPLGMLAQAASVAAFPYLASDIAQSKWGSFAEFLRNGLRRLMFIALPMSTLLVILAQPIATMLFNHGEFARTPGAVQNTALAFAFYTVGMFAWAGQQFVARGLYALQDTKTPTIVGSLITFLFFLPLCYLVSHFYHDDAPRAILGLALATSVGACAHFCGVLIAIEKKLARAPYQMPIGSERVLGTILRTLVACLAMGCVGLIAKNLCDALLSHLLGNNAVTASFWVQGLRIALIAPFALLAFAAAARKIHIPEYDWLLSKIKRRRAKTT